jgi:hypothetical protein
VGAPEKMLYSAPLAPYVHPVPAPVITPQCVAESPIVQVQLDPGSIPVASTSAMSVATGGSEAAGAITGATTIAGAVTTAGGVAAGIGGTAGSDGVVFEVVLRPDTESTTWAGVRAMVPEVAPVCAVFAGIAALGLIPPRLTNITKANATTITTRPEFLTALALVMGS